MTVLGRALRLLLGLSLVWCAGLAAAAPEMPWLCTLIAGLILITTFWRPQWGLVLVAGCAPAGALLAPSPARAAELFAWTMLAAWLLRLWRPLPGSPWPRAITFPAALYGAALVSSWLTLTIGGAAGIPFSALPAFLFESISRDYLIFSSPEAETWTLLQSSTGLGILLAAAGITRDNPRLVRLLSLALVISSAVLAIATLFDVVRQWAEAGYAGGFLLRYLRGERFSLHLADLNAAGSVYVLAAVAAAAYAILDPEHRGRWLGLLGAMMPALWLTGSRTSWVAACGGLLVLAAIRRQWQPTRRQQIAAAALAVVVFFGAAQILDRDSNVRGSAGRAVNLRSQFSVTSARMLASSPIFGVGIGRYFDRSAEFMPDELRALYNNENAHNYFAQQFAELGIVGGLLFLWLIVAGIVRGWTWSRRSGDPWFIGLFAGTAAYLLTCVTGHPLLVPEAALPFWAAFGVIGGMGGGEARTATPTRVITAVVCALLGLSVGRVAASYSRATALPGDMGFHGLETAADGANFRWMTRHAVTYVPNEEGFVRLRVRAEERSSARPILLETAIGGHVVDRRNVPSERWVSYDVPVRERVSTPFRRVDLRVNQVWTQEVRLGRRLARRPVTVMVEEIRWISLAGN